MTMSIMYGPNMMDEVTNSSLNVIMATNGIITAFTTICMTVKRVGPSAQHRQLQDLCKLSHYLAKH